MPLLKTIRLLASSIYIPLAAACIQAAPIHDPHAGKLKVHSISHSGKTTTFFVKTNTLFSVANQWRSDMNPFPVNIQAAILKARNHVALTKGTQSSLQLVYFECSRIERRQRFQVTNNTVTPDVLEEYWFMIFRFDEELPNGRPALRTDLNVVMLLDGTMAEEVVK